MYKLSPSDFAYLYKECKLCYCLKVKHGIYQPSMPMPGVFSAINTRLQAKLVGQDLQILSPNLPAGQVILQEAWVESQPVPDTSVYIKGKYDLLVRRPDGTHILVDLKISQPHEDKIEKYKTQLAAYQFALEHPTTGKSVAISQLGLLIFYPDTVSFQSGSVLLAFPPRWLEVPQDQTGFLAFAKDVSKLLLNPLPDESPNCKWCQYRHMGDQLAHIIR